MRVKYMSVKDAYVNELKKCPSFHASGSIKGMKEKYYGKRALLVRSGNYIYNVSEKSYLYDIAK